MIVSELPRGLRLFLVVRGSIVPRIAPALLIEAALALAVTALWHHQGWHAGLGVAPLSLVGLALAIFLGFRNSASYDRFWEGRRLWGELLARTRSFHRVVATWTKDAAADGVGGAAQDGLVRRIVLRQVAVAHALRHRLRDSDPAADLAPWLPPEEADAARNAPHPVEMLLQRQSRDLAGLVREGRLDVRIATALEEQVAGISLAAASCERIKTTPVPVAYTLLLHRTATLYCGLLPFGLVDTLGWFSPVICVLVTYTFFGLDALGDELQRPFGLQPHQLPLSAMCRLVERSALATLGERELPPELEPVDGQLM